MGRHTLVDLLAHVDTVTARVRAMQRYIARKHMLGEITDDIIGEVKRYFDEQNHKGLKDLFYQPHSTYRDLRDLAARRGIVNYSRKTKDELARELDDEIASELACHSEGDADARGMETDRRTVQSDEKGLSCGRCQICTNAPDRAK